jgi:hypothetical protein
VNWGTLPVPVTLCVAIGIALAKNRRNLLPTTWFPHGVRRVCDAAQSSLVWIYLSWVICWLLWTFARSYWRVLLNGNGWHFRRFVCSSWRAPATWVSRMRLVDHLRIDGLHEPVLETLVTLDWVGRLDGAGADAEARYVMLASLPSRRWSRWCRRCSSRCRQPARSGTDRAAAPCWLTRCKPDRSRSDSTHSQAAACQLVAPLIYVPRK